MSAASPAAAPLLALEAVHAAYGSSQVLRGVSLDVRPGEIVALLGRNGAGKTTTIRSVIGFLPLRSGRVLLRGEQVSGRPPHRIARAGVGLVPQGRGIFPTLTVRENLLLGARWRGGGRDGGGSVGAGVGRDGDGGRHAAGGSAGNGAGWDLQRVYQLFPRLAERERNRGDQLSGGEQQMLAIGRALLTNPDVLLLDEPSEGLAPLIVRQIATVLRQLREAGLAVLLVEQNVPLALSVADRLYVLSKGEIVHADTPAGLRGNPAVMHRFLGV